MKTLKSDVFGWFFCRLSKNSCVHVWRIFKMKTLKSDAFIWFFCMLSKISCVLVLRIFKTKTLKPDVFVWFFCLLSNYHVYMCWEFLKWNVCIRVGLTLSHYECLTQEIQVRPLALFLGQNSNFEKFAISQGPALQPWEYR